MLANQEMMLEVSPDCKFRGDVEGLRAVAIGLVLLYHADSSLMSGGFIGVDMFFVISGFLITRLLLGELRRTGTISLRDFYARRARRLLPAAAVVLTVVGALTVALVPRTRWIGIGYDIVSSALYIANWRFAENAVDYLKEGGAPSPVLHFWSLAVEEQFYLIWPFLILLVSGLSGRRRSTRGLLLGAAVFAVPSLLWSVHVSYADPASAFFVTTTRIWEPAIGALIAVLASNLERLPKLLGAVVSWCGLAAVMAAGVLLSTETPFPGWCALIPTLGVAAVIAGGPSADRAGPLVLLGSWPMRAIGALSYSLYLWHWPILVIGRSMWGELTRIESLSLLLLSVLLAYLTYRLVEKPIRASKRLVLEPLASLKMGGLVTLAVSVAGLLVTLSAWPPPGPLTHNRQIAPAVAAPEQGGPMSPASNFGALTLAANPRGDQSGAPADRADGFIPAPLQASRDVPQSYADGCHAKEAETAATYCTFGPDKAEFTVALVGDSHAAQWTSPVATFAEGQGWRMRVYTKSACPLADVVVLLRNRPCDQCAAWNRNVIAALTAPDGPDLVITSNTRYLVKDAGPADSREALRKGFARSWQRLVSGGTKIVVLADTPYPGIHIAECVATNHKQLTKCGVPRATAITEFRAQRAAVADVPGVALIDLNDAICPTDVCAPVIGGVLVYSDTNHVTDTYARTLGPRLAEKLKQLL